MNSIVNAQFERGKLENDGLNLEFVYSVSFSLIFVCPK